MRIEPIHHVAMRPEYNSPFSAAYAIEGGRLIFFSGCCTVPTYHKHPHDPDEERQWLAGDFRQQTERTLNNIKAILEAAGANLHHVVKTTVFLKDLNDFAAMNEVYGRYFTAAPPARSTVQVARLPKDALVEIEVIAAA